jgi:hypothetical protein
MKPLIKIHFILLLIIMIGIISCRKLEQFPIEPAIEFIAFEKIYNSTDSVYDKGVLKISFKDGDGDIGLHKYDTFPPFHSGSEYYYNLVITFFELQNGLIKEVPLVFYNSSTQTWDTIPLSARIPYLTPEGVNKSISGEIYDTMFIYNYNSDFDTLQLEAFIYDRALHKSNVVTTGLIVRK